jgi:hypothetical protein
MPEFDKPNKPGTGTETDNKSVQASNTNREQKLAKQLRDNLAKRKNQSKARNTKPRKFKKLND